MTSDYTGIEHCNLILSNIPEEYFIIEKLLVETKTQLEKIKTIKIPDKTEEYEILSYISLINSKDEYNNKLAKDRKLAKFVNKEIKIKICFPDLKTTKFKIFREFDRLRDIYFYIYENYRNIWRSRSFQIGNQKKLYNSGDMNMFLIDAELHPPNIFIKIL